MLTPILQGNLNITDILADSLIEINNDDIACSHGATVSQMDEETLFFLKSRGINEVEARNLLTHAFIFDIIDKIPVLGLLKEYFLDGASNK